MKFGVALTSALEALKGNPLRSFLTMLGIMIGVASVMAMMAISDGAAKQVDAQISSLGANNLTVPLGPTAAAGALAARAGRRHLPMGRLKTCKANLMLSRSVHG